LKKNLVDWKKIIYFATLLRREKKGIYFATLLGKKVFALQWS
jgi:hypothetical protein